MAPLEAEKETLGDKHKKLNKLVHDAIAEKKLLDETAFTEEKQDLNNIIKIDIASHNKDIDYILSVLKSEDMLYVSRAIKQSPWLAEDEYAHIVNPDYLRENIYPFMTAKASNKLHKHIRRYLKAEDRVEEFYKNETNQKAAVKWLSRCSIPFIEANIGKHMDYITNLEFKRVCERSVTIFEAGMKDHFDLAKFTSTSFLLRTHADKYFDVLDKMPTYYRPEFGQAATEIIMKQIPHRIMSNFLRYKDYIHIPIFLKHIKREEVQDFLLNLANKDEKEENDYRYFFNYDVFTKFVSRMPKEEQFKFVKKVFLVDETILAIKDEPLEKGTEMFAIKQIYNWICFPKYYWYEFAPFHIAFDELKKLIQSEPNIDEKYDKLNILLTCARTNPKHVLAVLEYYFKTFAFDEQKSKDFIDKLISKCEIYKYDNETWNTFTEIINNFNVYSEDPSYEYNKTIILYHILKNKEIPEKCLQHFFVDILNQNDYKLNQVDKNVVFKFLFNYLTKKIENQKIQSEDEFKEATATLQQLLELLLHWDKQLKDYPFALDRIKELVRIRKEHSWDISLSSIYNRKKSWRPLMFEESIMMYPSQKVCVNALKHDPELLVRYGDIVEGLCSDDAISLIQLLRKIRIYWSDSLVNSWKKSYLERLDKLGGHKALARGLFTLLPREPLVDILTKHAPIEAKIDWNNTNELTLGLQRSFAKNMHISRPPPPADAILMYAKGDFLQYALPSLLAIYYNMGSVKSEEHIPKLLDAPVSLQKHGLRFAFIKLKHDELKYHLTNVWKTSKNISIRAVSFVLLFELMCKEKNDDRAAQLWTILDVFIDNLSYKEDKKIYEKLSLVEQVPNKIKPKFLIKSYKFLKNLIPSLKNDKESYERSINHLAAYTREVMEEICPEFVVNIITEYLNENFLNKEYLHTNDMNMMSVLSSYLLCSTDEKSQIDKYERMLAPLIKRALDQWDEMHNNKYNTRNNFQKLLNCFARDLNEYVITKKMLIPSKLFKTIQQELNTLSITQNYIMLTMWKLIVKKTAIIDKMEKREDWQQITSDIVPEYGKFCLDVLKEDVKSYFSCIYILFAKVLKLTLREFLPEIVYFQIYKAMLSDKDFIPAYLVILEIFTKDRYFPPEQNQIDIQKILRAHPSVEVKMHYHSIFTEEDENELVQCL